MGLLVAKGFLKTNLDIPALPNIRIKIDDAIWAGKNVEPRILEVLPAAVLRLNRHFDLDAASQPELARAVEQLRRRSEQGDLFCGVPYDKYRIWADFPLDDKRMKLPARKKIVKTFRLEPPLVEKLRSLSKAKGCSETSVLERMIEKWSG